MGIYPQFVLALGRPVDSIAIVESDARVIKIVTRAWIERRDRLVGMVIALSLNHLKWSERSTKRN